jgi:hypothetical protein
MARKSKKLKVLKMNAAKLASKILTEQDLKALCADYGFLALRNCLARGLRGGCLVPDIDKQGNAVWDHLDIRRARYGFGLFATHAIRAGTRIPILGRHIRQHNPVPSTHEWSYGKRGYVPLQGVRIDGRLRCNRGGNVAMMANEANEPHNLNAMLHPDNFLYVLKDIEVDTEILTHYGQAYDRDNYNVDSTALSARIEQLASNLPFDEERAPSKLRAALLGLLDYQYNLSGTSRTQRSRFYYAVSIGHKTGVYTCWPCVQATQTKCNLAHSRKFASHALAIDYLWPLVRFLSVPPSAGCTVWRGEAATSPPP